MRQLNLSILRTVLTLVMGLCLSIGVMAQDWVVSGVVRDEAGEGIPGASVIVKGTKQGTVTNLDGNYRIVTKKGATLVFSYIGCTTQEIAANTNKLDVTLRSNAELLDEVVVLGYGAQTRKQDLSASVGVISNPDELVKRPVTSTESMLQGQIPGVTIQANGGDPTSTPSIVIRGQGSVNDAVLWVVDNVPGAPIPSMNDIESIVVLKDAASAAIYGAQSGAGGVVLVTTKRGKQGPASISYEGQFGFRKATKIITPLDAAGQMEMRRRSYEAANSALPDGWDPEKNPWIKTTRTNWMDEIFRTAFYQRHSITLNAGNETTVNRVSFNYNNDEGTLRNTYSKNLSVRYNGTFNLNKWVTAREDLTWVNYESRTSSTTSGYTGVIMSALWMPASATVYNPLDGTYGGVTTEDPAYEEKYGKFSNAHGDVVNPVRLLEAANIFNRTSSVWSTSSLEIHDVIEGLKFISRFSYNVDQNMTKTFNPIIDEPGKPNTDNSLVASSYRTDNWIAENTLTYENSFGKHRVSGLFSVTADHYEARSLQVQRSGFADESKYLQYFDKGTGETTATDWLSGPDSNVALVARAAYSYDDRYFVTASWRRDYAGRLVKESNHGDFPAVTAAWKLSNENFFDNTGVVNLLKIRGSWGKVGNVNSVSMGYKGALLSSDDNIWHQGEWAQYGITGGHIPWGNMVYNNIAVNPLLTWEKSNQWDVGIDLELFRNRLSVSLDYFDKKTTDLIQEQTINWPGTIGLRPMVVNLGEVSNRGFEIAANWNHRVNRDWTYYVSANAAYLKNKIVNIGVTDEDGQPGVWTRGGAFRSTLPYIYQDKQGEPFGSFYLIKTDGIFQSDEEAAAYTKDGNRIQPNAKAGDLKFVDFNNDGVINDNDRQYMGNADPDWTYSFALGAQWKDLSINAMFQGVQGAQAAYVAKSITLSDVEGNFNRSAEILNAWTPENRGSNIPRLSRNDPNGNFSTPSDWYLEDASYFRLKSLTINYNLTSLIQKWGHLLDRKSQLNVYVSGENIFTHTKYSGMDPECGGYDALRYPVSRTFSFGINLTY